MQENQTRSHRSAIAVAFLVILLAATILYAGAAMGQQSASDSKAISDLMSTVATLQGDNQALQSQVATLAASSSPSPNATGQLIYSNSIKSVVTVEGARETTVETFFGPETSITDVLGSGFITTYQGTTYVITNYHVVAGDSNLTVTFSDGDGYPGTVIGSDPYSDLAVVQVGAPASEQPPLQLASSSTVSVGEPVYVIGNPYGLSGSMTYGIVSQVGRTIVEESTTEYTISGVIQFSAPINPGNSGGPLLDAQGNVIGITTAEVNGSQGLGFAIPSNTIIQEMPSLVASGNYAQHSYLGIDGTDMNYQLAEASNSNITYGVLVESVAAGGPAAKAGLRGGDTETVVDGQQFLLGGDIIVSINGTKIVDQDALATYLQEYTLAGQTIELGIIRSGAMISVEVTLSSLPQSA
jgi:S1-C subfamily serine protease